jgi:hypothetical protein
MQEIIVNKKPDDLLTFFLLSNQMPLFSAQIQSHTTVPLKQRRSPLFKLSSIIWTTSPFFYFPCHLADKSKVEKWKEPAYCENWVLASSFPVIVPPSPSSSSPPHNRTCGGLQSCQSSLAVSLIADRRVHHIINILIYESTVCSWGLWNLPWNSKITI